MSKTPKSSHEQNYKIGSSMILSHPMFRVIGQYATIKYDKNTSYEKSVWAIVDDCGEIYVNSKKMGTPENWCYVLAHCMLHLGLGHFPMENSALEYNIACDCFIAKFLFDLKIGKIPNEFTNPINLENKSEEKYYKQFLELGVAEEFYGYGTAGIMPDMKDFKGKKQFIYYNKVNWAEKLAIGMSFAVTSAVNVVAGVQDDLSDNKINMTIPQTARNWFISSYPLLGAIASNFNIIEDPLICQRQNISIAAVNPELREIYINPAAGLKMEECKFVMAHEFLHVGLRHETRVRGRDHDLWNVACDYVINAWLIDMHIGTPPALGILFDQDLSNLSAETIYDRITSDMRQARKLATLRGVGLGDILKPTENRNWWEHGIGINLDEFYRNSLSQGLDYHNERSRGYIPAGLVEEIKVLSFPAIPWDAELARWFDIYFKPVERIRSYSRISRRQSSTPDIPRPGYIKDNSSEESRTFGVLLDTSGSMDRNLLAKALGAIASYSISKDVYGVRVVFCDASPYDQGYMRPEDIAETVKVKGRGGTILQPGIDLLNNSKNFPKNAPLLIITDAECDKLNLGNREHAYLIPQNSSLPFVPKGKVFRIS